MPCVRAVSRVAPLVAAWTARGVQPASKGFCAAWYRRPFATPTTGGRGHAGGLPPRHLDGFNSWRLAALGFGSGAVFFGIAAALARCEIVVTGSHHPVARRPHPARPATRWPGPFLRNAGRPSLTGRGGCRCRPSCASAPEPAGAWDLERVSGRRVQWPAASLT